MTTTDAIHATLLEAIACGRASDVYCLAVALARQARREHPRVICAWCRAELKTGYEPVSHGICRHCAEQQETGRTIHMLYPDNRHVSAGEVVAMYGDLIVDEFVNDLGRRPVEGEIESVYLAATAHATLDEALAALAEDGRCTFARPGR